MTLVISANVVPVLAAAGTSNNPIILWDALDSGSGTWSTGIGTEVNSAAYAGTGTTFDHWQATPDGSNEAALEVDLGSAQDIEFAAIASHNLADIGATVRIQKSTDGVTWTAQGGTDTPSDNQAIGFYFPSASARYWRVLVTNASDDVTIAVAVFGTPITLEQRIYASYTPPITPTNVELQSNVSEGGHLLGSSVTRQGSSAQASLTHIDPATLRGATWKAFQAHFNKGGGMFWAWRPTKYGDFYYAWRDGAPIVPKNMGVNELMQFDMSMRFYDDT